MARNNNPNQPNAQETVNVALKELIDKINLYTNTEGTSVSDEEKKAGIIQLLTKEIDKLILLVLPEKTEEAKKAKQRLGWVGNNISIPCKLVDAPIALFSALYWYSLSGEYKKEYAGIVKKLTVEEAEKLYVLLDYTLNEHSSRDIFKEKTDEQIDAETEQIKIDAQKFNDPTRLQRYYINLNTARLDTGDTREYINEWYMVLKQRINDLTKIFQQWKDQQQTQSDKRVNVFGFAKTFISKTAGSQEFVKSSLPDLVKRYGHCKEPTQQIVINFWNDCVGTYNAETGKFTIDAKKLEQSKNDATKLEVNKKNTTKKSSKNTVETIVVNESANDEPSTEPATQPETKPDAVEPKETKTETDADLIAREKKRIDNLGKAIANLTNNEKQTINQPCSVISDDVQKRKLAYALTYARLQRLTTLRAYWEDKMKTLKQRIEEIDKAEKTIQDAQQQLQDAQKRLDELLNSIRENQK